MGEPFALELYRRFLSGETVDQLAAELAIPSERIDQRIRAAAAYRARQQQADPQAPCRESLAALAQKLQRVN